MLELFFYLKKKVCNGGYFLNVWCNMFQSITETVMSHFLLQVSKYHELEISSRYYNGDWCYGQVSERYTRSIHQSGRRSDMEEDPQRLLLLQLRRPRRSPSSSQILQISRRNEKDIIFHQRRHRMELLSVSHLMHFMLSILN